MAIDPSIYRGIDTQFGLKLSDLLNPTSIAQRQSALDEQNMGNQLRQMQVMQGVEQMRRAPVLAQRENQQWQAQQAEAQRVAKERADKEAMFAQATPEQQKLLRFGVQAKDVFMPKVPDWQNPAFQKYEQDKARFAAGLKPKSATTDATGIPVRKPMTADQEAKYRQKFGDAYGSTITALQSSSDVVKTAQELKNDAGLEGMSGLSGYFWNRPGGAAASAQQKFETLQGKITKMAKDAAAASGSIGPMAVQEWKILRDQVIAIDPTKLDAKQMQDVLDELIVQSQNAARITEESYNSTFSSDFEQYPQFANPRGAMPKDQTKSGAPAYDAEKESRYQAWKSQQGK